MTAERWPSLLGADPRPWLLTADEAPARWLARAALYDDPDEAARRAVLDDPGVRLLLDTLPDGTDGAGSHASIAFPTNPLRWLHDLGVRGGDDARVEARLEAMLGHQDAAGRFELLGRLRKADDPRWGSLRCDHHAIAEVLVRFGRGAGPRARRGLAHLRDTVGETAQGPGWLCTPHTTLGWRGPGRKADVCPQVTLQGIRARLEAGDPPAALLPAARTVLSVWRGRTRHKPYLFGHGRRFKALKWPPVWYDAAGVLDTLGRLPALFEDADARAALAEIAACMVAFAFGPGGRATPRSTARGYAAVSWGQKKQPSATATAHLCRILRPLEPLVDDIRAVDVAALPTTAPGGAGPARPPA